MDDSRERTGTESFNLKEYFMGREIRMVPPRWQHPINKKGEYIAAHNIHYKTEEAIWYQVYETVSEGTPVTPPFETQQELIEYLVIHGDFYQQKCQNETKPGYSREVAEQFVLKSGWCPSIVISNGVIKSGIDSVTLISKTGEE